jgi:hypothetical protein
MPICGRRTSPGDLAYADFRGANVQGAVFQNANLYGAKMQGVEAQQADFLGANLGGAYLEGAMLLLPSAQRSPSPSEIAHQRRPNGQQAEGQEHGQARERDHSRGR